MKSEESRILSFVYIYTNLEKLVEQMTGTGIPDKRGIAWNFAKGFNSVKGTMSMVDIGESTNLVIAKVSGMSVALIVSHCYRSSRILPHAEYMPLDCVWS